MIRFRALFLAFCLAACLCDAATFRWASISDHSSADPHAQNQIVNNAINGQVYEALGKRGRKLEVSPGLAESWSRVSPTVWRINLRRGVKWHDGSDFTADDVVLSLKRAHGDAPTLRVYRRYAGQPRHVAAPPVELPTPAPHPVILERLAPLAPRTTPWRDTHSVELVQEHGLAKDLLAARAAVATGH